MTRAAALLFAANAAFGCHPERAATVSAEPKATPGTAVPVATASGAESNLAFSSDVPLVEATWQDVADQACCLDAKHLRWYPSGPEWPRLVLDLQSDQIEVRAISGEGELPSEVPEAFYADVLGPARGAGTPITMPEGSHRIASVESGYLLAVDRGRRGGGLYFLPSAAAGQEQRPAAGVGKNLLKDENLAVEAVASLGPQDAVILLRLSAVDLDLVCLSREARGTWSETARFSVDNHGVLGPDDAADAGDGASSAIFVSDEGNVVSVSCTSGVRSIARIPLLDIWEREHEWKKPEARPRSRCLSRNLSPMSARRFADGTLAITTRHTLTLLRPVGERVEERWFVRESRCGG